jgi:autophagy-related protein 16
LFISDLKLRLISGGAAGGPSHIVDAASNEKISFLEKKLYALQEELTELHRRRSENAQQIIDQVYISWLVLTITISA